MHKCDYFWGEGLFSIVDERADLIMWFKWSKYKGLDENILNLYWFSQQYRNTDLHQENYTSAELKKEFVTF